MSDRNTSAPNSWNNFTHMALVSDAVSLLFSGRSIIKLVALFLNLVDGVANTISIYLVVVWVLSVSFQSFVLCHLVIAHVGNLPRN